MTVRALQRERSSYLLSYGLRSFHIRSSLLDSFSFFNFVFFNAKVIDDKLLPLRCILTHVVGQHLFQVCLWINYYRIQANIFIDKVLELTW